MSKLSPFDFVNSICSRDKPDLIKDDLEAEKAYLPYIINRQFSYFPDTVLVSNELNQRSQVSHKYQYEFYRNLVRPAKRFAKWHKKASDDKLEVAAKFFKVSKRSLTSSIDLISDQEIDEMRKILAPGGRK